MAMRLNIKLTSISSFPKQKEQFLKSMQALATSAVKRITLTCYKLSRVASMSFHTNVRLKILNSKTEEVVKGFQEIFQPRHLPSGTKK